MLTIVVLMALAASCRAEHDSDLWELLKNVSTGNIETKLDEHNDDMDYQQPVRPNLDNSLFCAMGEARQSGAEEAREEDYPWAALVVHSNRHTAPLICTAAAVQDSAFLTAGRCIATSKCTYITVVYHKESLLCDAFVFPPLLSKQWFDDLGIITTYTRASSWQLLPPRPAERPLGPGFTWFDTWRLYEPTNTVVGYVANPEQPTEYKLYVLRNVYASNFLCHSIMRNQRPTNDYYVPCYHPCTVKQHFAKHAACERYLAGLGHVVLDQSGTPVGIATWTCRRDGERVSTRPLPVGVAVPNSASLGDQLTCASRIAEERARGAEHYYGLCKSLFIHVKP